MLLLTRLKVDRVSDKLKLARLFRRKPKLLLDECVTRRVITTDAGNDVQHSVDAVGWGAKDSVIRNYAKSTGQTIVSRDYNMLCQCLDNGIGTALH